MSKPYIAYQIDAMNMVSAIATACETTPAVIGWGLPQMWLHCFRGKTEVIKDTHLLAFFGRCKDVGPALEAFGFLEGVEDGWRVRGAVDRLSISRERSEAGKKGRAVQLAGRANAGNSGTNTGRAPGKTRADAGQGGDSSDTGGMAAGSQDGPQVVQQGGRGAGAGTSPKVAERVQATAQPTRADGGQGTGRFAGNSVLPGPTNSPIHTLSPSSPRGRVDARPPARAGAPAREEPLPWPGPQSEPASLRFFEAIKAFGNLGGPPSSLTPRVLAELANELGDEAFAAGVDAAIADGQAWPGWRVRRPENWLRQQAERERFKAKTVTQQRRKGAPTCEDIEAGRAAPFQTVSRFVVPDDFVCPPEAMIGGHQ